MKNLVQDGAVVTLTAPYDVASGGGALVGVIFGVATGDVAATVDGEFAREGVFDIAKAAVAVAQGDKIYWDNANKVVTTASAGNLLVGAATEAAAGGDATARVLLGGAVDESTGGVGAALADLTENGGAIGGANDGDLPDLAAADAAANAAAVRELATTINALLAQLRAAGVIAAA